MCRNIHKKGTGLTLTDSQVQGLLKHKLLYSWVSMCKAVISHNHNTSAVLLTPQCETHMTKTKRVNSKIHTDLLHGTGSFWESNSCAHSYDTVRSYGARWSVTIRTRKYHYSLSCLSHTSLSPSLPTIHQRPVVILYSHLRRVFQVAFPFKFPDKTLVSISNPSAGCCKPSQSFFLLALSSTHQYGR